MKQTALDYFMQSLGITKTSKFEITDTDGSPKIIHVSEVFEQAKAMEKEQSLTMSDYNLEELAKEFAIQQLADPKEYDSSIYAATIKNTYMVGFQKALELLTFKSE